MTRSAAPVYQVKITLKDIEPPIWRRLLVPLETKLSRFHDIIQAAMGWQDSHLHVFKVGVVNFSYPYEPGHLEEMTAVDSRYVKLIHIVQHIRPFHEEFHFAFEYEYDFGDSWMHEIVFEDVLSPDPRQKAPVRRRMLAACGATRTSLKRLKTRSTLNMRNISSGVAVTPTPKSSTWMPLAGCFAL